MKKSEYRLAYKGVGVFDRHVGRSGLVDELVDVHGTAREQQGEAHQQRDGENADLDYYAGPSLSRVLSWVRVGAGYDSLRLRVNETFVASVPLSLAHQVISLDSSCCSRMSCCSRAGVRSSSVCCSASNWSMSDITCSSSSARIATT